MTTSDQNPLIKPPVSVAHRLHRGRGSFTLIEMLAVIVIITVLVGLLVQVASYIQRQMAISNTKSQIAAISAAIENYRSDFGIYPVSSPVRFSSKGLAEASNNWHLYRALSGANGKQYMNFSPNMIGTNTQIPQVSYGAPLALTIYDPWGTPYNYFCSPGTAYSANSTLPAGWPPYMAPYTSASSNWWYGGSAVGGQVNVGSFDLFSYGPDKSTYVAGATNYSGGFNYAWYFGAGGTRWTNPTNAWDDITNFRK